MFEQGLESFSLLKDESMVAVCTIKYLEVGIIHPGEQMSVSIISVLGKGLEMGIKLCVKYEKNCKEKRRERRRLRSNCREARRDRDNGMSRT